MWSDRGKLQERIIVASWGLLCVSYFLPFFLNGSYLPFSPVWYFERQLQWIPFFQFDENCVRAGIFPAWVPHFYSGFPLLAYPPNFFFFPFSYLWMLVGYARGHVLFSWAGYLGCGWLFYNGLRKLDLSPVASLVGLLGFICGPYFAIAAGYDSYEMFALVTGLWGAVCILRDEPRMAPVFAVVAGFGVAMDFDLEQEFYVVSVLFVLSLLISRPPRFARVLALGLGFGLAVTARFSTLLNLAAYMPHTARGKGITFTNYIGSGAFPGIKAILGGLTFPTPQVLPVNQHGYYAGLVILVLALIGLKRLRAYSALALAMLALVGLYAVNWPPLLKILFHIPVLNRMALHYSSATVLFLGIAILAALGAQEVYEKRSWWHAPPIILAAIVVASLSFRLDRFRALALIAAAALALAALVGRKHGKRLYPAFLVLAVVFDVAYAGVHVQHWGRVSDFAPRPSVQKYLAEEKAMVRFWPLSVLRHEDTQVHPLVGMLLPLNLPGTHSPLGYWRVPVMRNAKLINLIAPGYLKLDPDGLFDGLDIAKPREAASIDEGDLYWLRLLNVGNLISRGAALNVKGIEPNGSAGDINFYRIPDPLPRYLLVPRIERYIHSEAVLDRIARQDWDPRGSVLVEDKIPFTNHSDNPGKVALKNFQPGKWEFDLYLPVTVAKSPPALPQYFLEVGETYLPGWRALTGGREFRVWRADYAFLGVALPPGASQLTLIYYPWQTRIGLWSSLAALLFWTGLGFRALVRGIRRGNRAAPGFAP